MNKDVIYIDVDDDVTAIIGKIKQAKEKIVALVPPKRVGTLQSAVNLRLLDRMAKSEKKQLVLITGNQALIALASNAKIPIAKNLQSKPELAEVPALVVDEGDDIIDGGELPVGDHAKTVPVNDSTRTPGDTRNDAVDATDLNIDGEAVAVGATAAASAGAAKKAAAKKGRTKIPNFDSFRKKLFWIITGGVALLALIIWMFVFAPAATIVITASTTPVPVNSTVKLGGTAATDYKAGVVNSVSQQDKKDQTVNFTATGQKDMGNKATGTLKISKLTQTDYTVPAGSQFTTSSGLVFLTNSDATIPASTPCFPTYCAQSTTVGVTAQNAGTNYNGVTGTATGPGNTTGTFQGATSGGSSNVVTVVSQDDIDRATAQLQGQSSDDEKKALTQKFTNGEIVVDGSFTAQQGAITSSPALNQPAPDGKAVLTASNTYTLQAVPKTELDSYLKAYLNDKLGNNSNQKVYSTGIDSATISNFKTDNTTMYGTINATGSVGPTIDENAIKTQVKGKKYGEVQQALQSVDGIKNVDVQFSYFWVQTVPNNTNKITIQFKVDNG